MAREYRFEQCTENPALRMYGISATISFAITGDEDESTYADYENAAQRVEDWCTNQFGPGGKEGQVWVRQSWVFAFWSEIEATVFKVRWC